MKRPGKCIGKKAFSNRLDAEAQVIRNYVFNRKVYGIYECPTCLDFHTTHLYDNRTSALRNECFQVAKKYRQKRNIVSKENADLWLYHRLLRYTGQPKPKKVESARFIKRTHIQTIISCAYNLMYTHLGISKPETTLVGVLPLVEQQRILQALTQK
jgi:hypothetical protein